MNLILASSHIQYRNACEALKKKGIKNGLRTVVLRFMPFDIESVEELTILDYPAQPLNKGIFKHIFFMLRLTAVSLRFRNRIDHIVIGESSARFMRYIATIINARNNLFVDDGMKSVYTFPMLSKYIPKYPILRKPILKKIHVITEYDIATDKNIRHKLSHVNRISRITRESSIDPKEIWFIGQPLVEDNLVSENDYRSKVIEELAKYKKVKYFMHRREKLALKYMTGMKHVEIIHNAKPFENYIESIHFYPNEVIGFYSTALYYAFKRMPDMVVIRSLKLDINEKVDKVYGYFEKTGIIVES